jgi:hypothetical protein
MRPIRLAASYLLCAAALNGGSGTAWADDPCAGFKWDVGKEHTLFSGTAALETGGTNLSSAPAASLNRLYEFQLAPQGEVTFAAPPGKKALPADARAGLATLKITSPGTYRISSDSSVWIDVVSNRMLLRAEDFQGQAGCDAPHKIVAFDLSPGTFVLQISGATQPKVRLTITQAPTRTL